MNTIKSEEFKEKVLGSGKTVLVDFFATWCGPCKMLSPIVEQISSESNGRFEVYKVDVDEASDVARQYGIMSVPTLIIFQDGSVAEKMVGLRSKKDILEAIESLL